MALGAKIPVVQLRKVRKNMKKKTKKGGRGFTRRNATVVLAQGAIAVPKKNFGTNGCPKSIPSLIKCMDARVPRTLGLPRAVGPYTVVRTTRLHQTSASFVLFCPFYTTLSNRWFNWCGIEDVAASQDVTFTNNTQTINMPMSGLAEACEVVPAAMTVQVMNPASLQTADGVFAMARVNQQLALGNTPAGVTYDEMASRVVSFYSPRMLTGGKLALRGVKCNAYPR